jgi:hypothetical protein
MIGAAARNFLSVSVVRERIWLRCIGVGRVAQLLFPAFCRRTGRPTP